MKDLSIAVIIAVVLIGSKLYFSKGSQNLHSDELWPLAVTYVQGGAPPEDRPMLLEFWATWCGPCRQSIPHLNEVNVKYHAQGLSVVGVSGEEAEVVDAFRARQPMNYTVAVDPSRRYARALGVEWIPHAFLIGRNGKVLWDGNPLALPESEIEKALEP